ncbi:penicillin-binding protein [Thermoflavimicrobium dichotomicum]|uniref:Penicillin-binding protein n=1 Tax=Thermoflavimicrobium dichotomicum TaxID=46223 RepID=A0A1I3MKY4_9BACL|nr:penicillin-binding protein [Thermoflavimicrobium dichotomicum]
MSVAIFLVTTIGAVGIGIGVVSAMVQDQTIQTKSDFEKSLKGLFQTSYAYFSNKDASGKPVKIGELRYDNNNRKLIKSLDEVSPYLIHAFISIEDRDFYEHHGIVLRSIVRAAYQQVVGSEVTTGGSTITQQLVKNIILNDRSKVFSRKAKEIILALRMEQMYSKDEILVYYLNSVFFGKGAHGRKMHGVEAAARGLFNTDAKHLHLAQAAYLAGMVQRPNALNPLDDDPKNLERGLKRMKLVLDKMREYEKISQREYEEALRFDIKKSLARSEHFNDGYERYPFIMFAIEDEAAETLMEMDRLNIQELKKQGKYKALLEEYKKKAVTGGYHFYTTIDEKLYNAINRMATQGLTFYPRTYKGKKTKEQLGATLIHNKTGAVLAFVSSSEKFNVNQQDHALHVSRQPGSTIKPLLVFAPAMEEGIVSPSSKIIDEKMRKRDGSGYYKNASGSYQGPVTVTEALKWSYNIPAIKTFNALGHQKGFHYLTKMGLPPDPNDGESAAIGGMTQGFTVEKMSAAFSTFANQGLYNKPFLISKVTDSDGKVIWEHKPRPVRVFSPQTAYKTTMMLKQVLNGTATYIQARLPSGYELAGKTGTTNEDRDLWFIGYTPDITLGVWGGYDYNFSMAHNEKFVKKAWVNMFQAAVKASPDLIPKGTHFKHPGYLGPEICGFECDEVAEYYRKLEEQRKKEEEEKKSKLPEIPIIPPILEPPPTEEPDQPSTEPAPPSPGPHPPSPPPQRPPLESYLRFPRSS